MENSRKRELETEPNHYTFIIKHAGQVVGSPVTIIASGPDGAILALIRRRHIPTVDISDSSYYYPEDDELKRVRGVNLEGHCPAWFVPTTRIVVDIQGIRLLYSKLLTDVIHNMPLTAASNHMFVPSLRATITTDKWAFVRRMYGPSLHPSFMKFIQHMTDNVPVDDMYICLARELQVAMDQEMRSWQPSTGHGPNSKTLNEHVLSADVASILSRIMPRNCHARTTHQRSFHVHFNGVVVVTDPDVVIDRYPSDDNFKTLPNRVMLVGEVKKELDDDLLGTLGGGGGKDTVLAALYQTLQSCGFALSDCHWSGPDLLLGHVALGMLIWSKGIVLLGVMDGVDGDDTTHRTFWCPLVFEDLSATNRLAKLLFCMQTFMTENAEQMHIVHSNMHLMPTHELCHDVDRYAIVQSDDLESKMFVSTLARLGTRAYLPHPMVFRKACHYYNCNAWKCMHECHGMCGGDRESCTIMHNGTVTKVYDYWCAWCSLHSDNTRCLRQILTPGHNTCTDMSLRRKCNVNVYKLMDHAVGQPYLSNINETGVTHCSILQYTSYANTMYINKDQLIAKLNVVQRHLDVLHNHGCVHGDVRLSNIMLGSDVNDANDVRLIDFDMCSPTGTLYPASYVTLPERHPGALPSTPMLIEHDSVALNNLIVLAESGTSIRDLLHVIDEKERSVYTGTPVKKLK